MEDGRLAASLVEVGLTEYQAETYVTLLDHGTTSATTVAEQSSVPLSRVYDVLRELEGSGYVETVEQDTLHARAAPPGEVLADLRSRSELLADAAGEIEQRWRAPAIDDHTVSLVKNPETAVAQAAEKVAGARYSVRVVAARDQLERLSDALATAHEQGCRVSLTVASGDVPTEASPPLTAVASAVRVASVPVPFLVLVDDRTVCFAPHGDQWGRFGLVVENQFLAHVFGTYYYASYWSLLPEAYRDEREGWAFDSLRSFVAAVWPLWRAGVAVLVTVVGTDVATGAERTVTGFVADVEFPRRVPREAAVRFEELQSTLTLFVQTGTGEEGVVSVGGKGAVYEDVRSRRVVVEAVPFLARRS
jgi:sugar-specific transcriptional regulator TrmB